MLKFFLKAAVFVCLTCSFCFLLQAFASPKVRDTNAFVAATIDKEKRLAELPSPRLIFVGGSNLAFGINSKKISDTLKIPVINMGVHAGLGVAFSLNETKAFLKKGDIVVLAIEYGLSKYGDIKLLSQLIDLNPNAIHYLDNSINDRLKLIDLNWQRCLSSLFIKPNETVYKRNGFSKEGDEFEHLNLPQANHLLNMDTMVYINYNAEINALNQFIESANLKGAKVFFTFPPYPESQFIRNKSAIDKYTLQIKETLHCPILNEPKTFVFPNTDFYDSAYHLDKNGREKRTQIFISLLKNKSIINYNI